ncbi:MAG: hypothetical protein HKO03_01770 [Acidimicrobiia bacterium]|nr:hypothetical protein [Acidimicrobiia bacterium]
MTGWKLSDLRLYVMDRAGGLCEWPSCTSRGEQMAHMRHRGMGGSPNANTPDNVRWWCVYHHDLFDGRRHDGLVREMRAILLLAEKHLGRRFD